MKTIRLYHLHTHEGVAYDPPPEGIELTVNDADAALLDAWGLTTPPPALADASTTPAADAPVADAAVADAPLAPRHDRRARVAMPAHDSVDADVDAATSTRTV